MLDLRTTHAIAYQKAHQARSTAFVLFFRKIKQYAGQSIAIARQYMTRRTVDRHYQTCRHL